MVHPAASSCLESFTEAIGKTLWFQFGWPAAEAIITAKVWLYPTRTCSVQASWGVFKYLEGDAAEVCPNVCTNTLSGKKIQKKIYQWQPEQLLSALTLLNVSNKNVSGDFLQCSLTKWSSIYSACWKGGWEVTQSLCIGNYWRKQDLMARDFFISQRASKIMWLESKQNCTNSNLK